MPLKIVQVEVNFMVISLFYRKSLTCHSTNFLLMDTLNDYGSHSSTAASPSELKELLENFWISLNRWLNNLHCNLTFWQLTLPSLNIWVFGQQLLLQTLHKCKSCYCLVDKQNKYFACQIHKDKCHLLLHGHLPHPKSQKKGSQWTLLDNQDILQNICVYLAAQKLGTITPHLLCKHVNNVILPTLELTQKKGLYMWAHCTQLGEEVGIWVQRCQKGHLCWWEQEAGCCGEPKEMSGRNG